MLVKNNIGWKMSILGRKQYRKRKGKKNTILKSIFLIICVVFILIMIYLTVNINDEGIIEHIFLKGKENSNKDKYIVSSYEIIFEDGNYTYNDNMSVSITIESYNANRNYELEIMLNNENMGKQKLYSSNNINIQLKQEGQNDIKLNFYEDGVLSGERDKSISYIKPYNGQFYEENSYIGVNLHIGNLSDEDLERSLQLIKNMGIGLVRVDIKSEEIIRNNEFDFENYDSKLNIIHENNIKILGILDTNFCDGQKALEEQQIVEFVNYAVAVSNQYTFINYFEICNEPNYHYKTVEEITAYSNIVNETKKALPTKSILAGSLIQDGEYSNNTNEFYHIITDNNSYYYSNFYSYHIYTLEPSNQKYDEYIKNNEELKRELGGFIRYFMTETGVPSIERIGEQLQAETLIQQSCIRQENNIKHSIIYNFRNTGTVSINYEHNYGLVNNDYSPKLSYYALKNYNENTNGAEYIGTINLGEGLEAHVYDKDGKPKIIAWSNNIDNQIQIPYETFIAKDLYGNQIENTEGTLIITTSPIYLDNIGTQYFYQAISNTATEKYTEFEEKFAEQIVKVPNLTTNLQQLKQNMTSLASISTLDENIAIQTMKEHYHLGDIILQAYQDKILDIEYVKLSSMLDMLDDIGNSYEDLVTVSAKTRNPNLEQTNQAIQEAEILINNNQDLEMVYPSKILEFSKNYCEEADYINGLEEENDIKTGLIVSNNLHSYLLANWANTFANLYIDQYLADNPVTITYSEITPTNRDVTATLTTNATVEVTNNTNNKLYTFAENGSFIFEYTIKGRAFTIEAKVSNIDKTPPKIEGIEEGKVYIQKIIPKISDTNLRKVELLLNGQVVKNYVANSEIKGEGLYQIVATDKAGNTTTMSFQIIENKEDGYQIEESFIKNIDSNTKMTDFSQKLNLKQEYDVYRNDQELESDGIVATGDVLKTKAGDTYTLIVTGDINKDGEVNIKDIVKMRKYLLERNNLDETELLAADANLDRKSITIKDLVRIRIIALTKGVT